MKQIAPLTLLTILLSTLGYAQWPGGPAGYPIYERNYINLQLQIITVALPQTNFAYNDTIKLPIYGSLTNIQTFAYWQNGESSYIANSDTLAWRFDARIIQNSTEYYRWSSTQNLLAKDWHDTISFLDWVSWQDTLRLALAPGTYKLVLWPKDEFINQESVAVNFTIDPPTLTPNYENSAPAVTYLLPAYPNPFNPVITIPYFIARDEKVNLDIYNSLGVKIITLVDDVKKPGKYELTWQASDWPSGLYHICLTTTQGISVKKIILAK